MEHKGGCRMPVTFRLDPETNQRINDLVARHWRTKAYYLREAVARSLLDVEDEYGVSAGLDRNRAGEEELYPPEQLWKNQPRDDVDFESDRGFD